MRKKKDGAIIPVSLSTALLRDEKGSIVGNMMVLADLTEHKRTEEEHRKMQAGLLQTNKMTAIGILASGIAHEINNPNNYILSNAQFLSDVWPCIVSILENYGQEHGEFYLGKISFTEAGAFMPKILAGLVDGAHRINNIINNLKNFARDEKPLHDQLVDVNKAIHVALSMLKNEIGKYTDCFFCSLGKDLPSIRGSFQQLEQVIVNLIMNSLQALQDRTRGIFISTIFDKSLGQIIIKVRDEGIGMTEDVRKYIFDPFFTTKLESGGTGLGLSICFTIVKEHQGTIDCESVPGKGTTFLLTIPAANHQV
jgi:signal transduction histidine kinase